jgi:Zn-finger nucleic acid-binding protein
MDCPKCKNALVNGVLSDMLLSKHCQECEGDWISGNNYQMWKSEKIDSQPVKASPSGNYDVPHVASPLDSKAAACPECGRILSRGKVGIKYPFYVEHCQSCGGFWCDRGEWSILEKIQLHLQLEQIFSSAWQAQVRSEHMQELERQALINKVGAELADEVFELAKTLEQHPNGDFAAAYLMRKFDRINLRVNKS